MLIASNTVRCSGKSALLGAILRSSLIVAGVYRDPKFIVALHSRTRTFAQSYISKTKTSMDHTNDTFDGKFDHYTRGNCWGRSSGALAANRRFQRYRAGCSEANRKRSSAHITPSYIRVASVGTFSIRMENIQSTAALLPPMRNSAIILATEESEPGKGPPDLGGRSVSSGPDASECGVLYAKPTSSCAWRVFWLCLIRLEIQLESNGHWAGVTFSWMSF